MPGGHIHNSGDRRERGSGCHLSHIFQLCVKQVSTWGAVDYHNSSFPSEELRDSKGRHKFIGGMKLRKRYVTVVFQ